LDFFLSKIADAAKSKLPPRPAPRLLDLIEEKEEQEDVGRLPQQRISSKTETEEEEIWPRVLKPVSFAQPPPVPPREV
jgi:hypothetical protein